MSKDNKVQQENQSKPRVNKPVQEEIRGVETAVSNPIPSLQRAYTDPRTLSPTDAHLLQRTIGNQALGRLIIQRKMTVGPVGDKYEQEADAVAKQVVNTLHAPHTHTAQVETAQRQEEEEDLQMKPEGNAQLPSISQLQRQEEEELQMKPLLQRQEEEEELQMKPLLQRQEEEELQMKPLLQRQEEEELQMTPQIIQRTSAAGFATDDAFENNLNTQRGGGNPLPASLRADFEPKFGADFSGVRVHTNTASHQLNQSIQAKAFTTGQDVFFRQGAYDPGSRGGQELIAHELTHVVQQNGSMAQQRKQTQMKPAVQRHHDHNEEVQMKPDLQRHEDHDEAVQMKPDIQLKSSCQCSSCSATDLPIQRKVDSTAHCPSCGCSTCGTTAPIQRQTEQTHDSGCACSSCSGGKDIQAKFIQTKTLSTNETPPVAQATTPGVIQRHSSWEHQMLGDAEPNDLAKIGAWQDLIEQTKRKGFLRRRDQEEGKVNIEGVGQIKKGNIMHVIAQELQRLNDWQKNPPQHGSSGDIDPTYQTVLVSLPGGGKDGHSPFIITYGELNTLADYYGNLELMKSADPEPRFQLVQSVRQETFFRLKDIYTQLKNSLTSTENKDQNVKDAKAMMKGNALVNQKLGFKFSGAMTPDYISGMAGQLELLGGIQKTGAQGDTNEYSASLARNACHFVPESWHAWSSYHQKGREAAKIAWDKKEEASKFITDYPMLYKTYKDKIDQGDDVEGNQLLLGFVTQQKENAETKTIPEAANYANEAILNNGFGDHYLQDSYAGGHMINKTKIMQWFVQWLDTKKWNMDFASDENWRKVQAMAYKQPEIASLMQYDKTQVQGYDPDDQQNKAQNPQAVEDIGGDDWTVRFKAIGLQVPTSLQTPGSNARKLMESWQTLSALDNDKNKQTGESLIADTALNFSDLKLALKDLIDDGIVYLDLAADKTGRKVLSGENVFNIGASLKSFKAWKFALRSQYVPKDITKFLSATKASAEGDDSHYQKMASAVTYQDYMAFMNNAYVQKSTNALHDAFCKGGLTVYSGTGEHLFKVYGDDAMFSSESSKGVKHSGETAHMSRDAIRNIISTGNDDGITTESILTRLPNKVKAPMPGGGLGPALKLEDWHNPSFNGNLKNYCNSEIFPNMGVLDKGAGLMASGGLSDFISKDKEAVHGSEAF